MGLLNIKGITMANSPQCTEADIAELVNRFYNTVRADSVLGPVFNAHINDWEEHKATMVQFWSSLILRTGSYEGTPMPKHAALPNLNADMFRHWLSLFHATTATLPNQALAEQANQFAGRIARSLWFGYQLNNHPNRSPADL